MAKISFHHSDGVTCSRQVMPSIVCKLEYMTTEPTLKNGRQVNTSKYAIDDSETRYTGLSALDFCLENQLAAGVNLTSAFVQPSGFLMVDNVVANVIKMSNSKIA